MEENWLFRLVKDNVIRETFIEHAIKTYHVGDFLYKQLRLNVNREKFRYGCFFHDIGKLLIELGKEPHTPKSREALGLVAKTPEYSILLKSFELNDYSDDEEVICAIEKHHDSDDDLSAYISIADQIASSESDENLKNKLKRIPISPLITFLNEMHGFGKYHFYHLRFYSFSKNELNALGRIFLLKLLYETIEELADVEVLYETLDGCRVVTKLDVDTLRDTVCSQLSKNLVMFIEKQNINELMGGAPDSYSQYTTLPKEVRPELIKLTIEKYKEDMLNPLKKKGIEKLEDLGLNDEILYNFVMLDDVVALHKKGIKGISKTKYHLFADEKERYPKWVIDAFSLKKKKIKSQIVDGGKPRVEKLLEKAGADVSNITFKNVVYNKLFPLVVAVNSIRASKIDFSFDAAKFLAIDDYLPLDNLARENPCANCGAFEGEVPLTPFIFEYKQHAKETVFKETEDEFRDRKKVICGLCQAEALLNTILCGTKLHGMQARVDTKTHMILYGLSINEDIVDRLGTKEFITKLLRDFKITRKSVYVKNIKDLQIIALSLAEYNVGIKNALFRQLFFSLLATRLKKINLILAFGINFVPKTLDNNFIQFPEKQLKIIRDERIDFFEYVYGHSHLPPKQQRDIIVQFYEKPFMGVVQTLKKGRLRYDDHVQEIVGKMSKNDELFNITNQMWEMAKIGGALETRRNVGSFLGNFRGCTVDIDKIANKILKNRMLSADKRAQIIEIHQKIRGQLRTLDEEKRKNLKKYVQKTKYLFNSKKFYELKKK